MHTLPPLAASSDELDALTRDDWERVLSSPPETAFLWVSAAAALGHAEAQTVLGQWLLDGRGAPRDAHAALHAFLLAAQQGHPMGMNMAGRCHEQGWGTSEDFGKAAHWYRNAVQTGLPEARYNLANLLASGQGVARNHAEAFALYQQAADQGYAKAFAKLGRYHEDGHIVPQDATFAMRCYQRGAEGGDFRGQFCYAGMLASCGRRDEAMGWLAKVMHTATRAYLGEAGQLLAASAQSDLQAVGQRMLAKAQAA